MVSEIESLEKKFDELDRDIEEFTQAVHEDDEGLAEDGDDTELSKFMVRKEVRKDKLVGNYTELRDRALFDEDNLRKDKSLMLELADKSTRQDIRTMKYIKSQLSPEDELYDHASDIISRLQDQKSNVSELRKR